MVNQSKYHIDYNSISFRLLVYILSLQSKSTITQQVVTAKVVRFVGDCNKMKVRVMRRNKYIIQVPYGAKTEIAKKIGIRKEYVSRALRYDSETAPSQMRIRDIAMKEFGGRLVKLVY